ARRSWPNMVTRFTSPSALVPWGINSRCPSCEYTFVVNMQLTGPEKEPSRRFVKTASSTVPSNTRYLLPRDRLSSASPCWAFGLDASDSSTAVVPGFGFGSPPRAVTSACSPARPSGGGRGAKGATWLSLENGICKDGGPPAFAGSGFGLGVLISDVCARLSLR